MEMLSKHRLLPTVTQLRVMRQERGLTQQEVAKAVGINQGYYSRVEKGDVIPSPALAERIVMHLGPPLSEEQVLYPQRFQNICEEKAS
jgi:predicted transcriptional regulator